MRVLLIADVHANLVALRAVLEDARQRGGWDAVWSLGDIVGYGPEPSACIDALQDLGAQGVAGNHDWAVIGKIPLTDFNYAAAIANQWTAAQLSPRQRSYLEGLPETLQIGEFTLAHGSVRDPIWEYLTDPSDAAASFPSMATPHGVVGHTHMASVFALDLADGTCRKIAFDSGTAISLKDARWIVNPGSVGQPRDRDPRAAYAILEYPAGSVTGFRVAYDIAATQEKMLAVGLPSYLADRLSEGR